MQSKKGLKAYVMIGAPGAAEGLATFAKEHYPVFSNGDFATMTQPVLVVNGDNDVNPNFSLDANWRADAYYRGTGKNSLLTVFGGEHIFGGISGYDSNETTDESPERVEFVNQSILAYLRSAIDPKDSSWSDLKKRRLTAFRELKEGSTANNPANFHSQKSPETIASGLFF